MNPFTESTVAQPLAESLDSSPGGEQAWPASFSDSDANDSVATSSGSATKTTGQALCLAGAGSGPGQRFAAMPARRRVRIRLSASSAIGRCQAGRSVSWARGGKELVRPLVRQKKCRSFFTGTLGAMGIAAGLNLAFPALVFAVDVNAASQTQLEAVRGIGPKTAQVIIQERSRGGEYESFQDLSERVKGIGPKKAASLQASGLTLSAPKSGTAGKVAASPQSPRADKGRP